MFEGIKYLLAWSYSISLTSELTRIRFTLVDLGLTNPAGVPWVAVAGETVVAVYTFASVTRSRQTVVDIRLTGHT